MTLNRKHKIESLLGRHVTTYEQYAILQKKSAQKLCDLVDLNNPSKILEIGCGTGLLTEFLQKKYPDSQITGIDIAKEMVHACRQKFTGFKSIKFIVADGESFKTTEKYDLIISNLTVQWFDNPVLTIEKYKKLLNENGKIYFSTLGDKCFKEWKNTLKDLNLPVGIIKHYKHPNIIFEQEQIVRYKDAYDFLRNLKKIGAGNPNAEYKSMNAGKLRKACKTFDLQYNGTITWHIIYGCLGDPPGKH